MKTSMAVPDAMGPNSIQASKGMLSLADRESMPSTRNLHRQASMQEARSSSSTTVAQNANPYLQKRIENLILPFLFSPLKRPCCLGNKVRGRRNANVTIRCANCATARSTHPAPSGASALPENKLGPSRSNPLAAAPLFVGTIFRPLASWVMNGTRRLAGGAN